MHQLSQQLDQQRQDDVSQLATSRLGTASRAGVKNSDLLVQESKKDTAIAVAMRFSQEGWPTDAAIKRQATEQLASLARVSDMLSTQNGVLLYGSRVVIPEALRANVLSMLHTGHMGMERMKKLARTAVYWPGVDTDIEGACRSCTACSEHQRLPEKMPGHPWTMPDKPWSRVHIDHAVNFMGTNWLVLIDAHSKYPCIHATGPITSRATIELLDEDFAHFGYPQVIVSDNAACFTSAEFQEWCRARGITNLRGAPYHPATNGAAERLVQSFKQSLKKSSLPPRQALLDFLRQYRRTPLTSGLSPSQLLNGRQIRTDVDTLLPSPAHSAQAVQQRHTDKQPLGKKHHFIAGQKCYARVLSPRLANQSAAWTAVVIIKRQGSIYSVRHEATGAIWARHVDFLLPRHDAEEDWEPGEVPPLLNDPSAPTSPSSSAPASPQPVQQEERAASPAATGAASPPPLRRPQRQRRAPQRYGFP